MNKIRIGTVFSGIGAIEFALKRLNYDYFDYRICNRLLNWSYGQKI